MKPILIFIGLVSLAFAGCSGTQTTESSAVPAAETTNSAIVVPRLAEITDANIALAEGKRLLDENQTESSIIALKRAVEIDPDIAEAYFHLGIAYALLDMQMQQAGQAAETVSNTNPKEKIVKTRAELAFEDAVKAYKKWIAKNPKDDTAYYYLGRTYAKLTNDEDAKEAFEKAVDLKPEDTEYQTELGAMLIKLAQYHAAIKPLRKAIVLDQANGRAIELLEDAEAGRKRVDYMSANKNSNTGVSGRSSNANSSSISNTSPATTPIKPPDTNTKPKKPEPESKSKKGDSTGDRPRLITKKPN